MKCRWAVKYLLNEMERGHPVHQRAKPAQIYAKLCSGGRFALRAQADRMSALRLVADSLATYVRQKHCAPEGS